MRAEMPGMVRVAVEVQTVFHGSQSLEQLLLLVGSGMPFPEGVFNIGPFLLNQGFGY